MGSRITLRPDLKAYALSKDRVVVFSESSHFLLHGELYVGIIEELLSGTKSKLELKSKLSPSFDPKMLNDAVKKLLEKGLATSDEYTMLPEAARAFWYENGVNAGRLENNLKNTKICVKSFTHLKNDPRDRFVESLEKLGFIVEDPSDFTVILTDSYLDERISDFWKELDNQNKPWIPLKFSGSKLWFGPIFDPKVNNCYFCLQQALKENKRVEVDIFGFNSKNLGYPSNSYLDINEDIGHRLSAIQLAKWLDNPKDQIPYNYLIVFDTVDLTTKLHPTRLIYCENCQTKNFGTGSPTYELNASPIVYNNYDGDRCSMLEDTLDELERIVSPVTGIVSSYKVFNVNGNKVASSIRNLPTKISESDCKKNTLRVPDVVVGKGKTKTQAVIGCLAESLERYNNSFFNQPILFASYDRIAEKALKPQTLLLFSDRQYENRHETNLSVGAFNRVPKKYDDSEIRWTKVHSLEGKENVYIPSSYCYLNYPFKNEVEMCPADTNGCASGNSIEEAIFYAILELIERDAVSIWWYNKIQYPEIDVCTINDQYIRKLVNFHVREGRVFRLIDITSDLKVPTFVAISHEKSGDEIYFGTSSYPNPCVAIAKCIHELNQMMVHRTENRDFSSGMIAPSQKDFARWVLNENLRDHPHLTSIYKKSFSEMDYPSIELEDFRDLIESLINILRGKNLSPYWLNMSHVDINFFTVRAIIPGLRHFWRRLGPGRLYNVPVEQGLLDQCKPESSMNPTPYFL